MTQGRYTPDGLLAALTLAIAIAVLVWPTELQVAAPAPPRAAARERNQDIKAGGVIRGRVTSVDTGMGPKGGAIFPSSNTARTGPDVTFSVTNVQAGEYMLAVRLAAANDQPAQEARQMIQVAGIDIDGLMLVTGSGGTVRGQVASDDGHRCPASIDQPSGRDRSRGRHGRRRLGFSGNGRVNADGTVQDQGRLRTSRARGA